MPIKHVDMADCDQVLSLECGLCVRFFLSSWSMKDVWNCDQTHLASMLPATDKHIDTMWLFNKEHAGNICEYTVYASHSKYMYM